MNCQERQDDLLLYAAGELDGPEFEALRAHLASGCLTCAGSLAEAEAVVALLGESLDPVAPSENAQRRLLADLPGRAAVRKPPAPVRPKNAPWAGWVPLAIAACIALLASIGVTIYLSSQAALDLKQQQDLVSALQDRVKIKNAQADSFAQRLAESESQNTAVNVHAADLERLNASLKESLHNEMTANDQLVKLLRDKNVSIMQLAGNQQPAASAVMIMDHPSRQAQFIAANLQPLAEGRTYELWLVPKEGKPIPAGIFAPHTNGAACMSVNVPENTGPLTALAVTDEPAGGVPQPTANGFVVSGSVVDQ